MVISSLLRRRTHTRILENKAVHQSYLDRKVPVGTHPYRNSFEPTANSAQIGSSTSEWQFVFGDGITITVSVDAITHVCDWKEAIHHMKISAFAYADKFVCRLHMDDSIQDSSCDKFVDKCFDKLHPKYADQAEAEAFDPDTARSISSRSAKRHHSMLVKARSLVRASSVCTHVQLTKPRPKLTSSLNSSGHNISTNTISPRSFSKQIRVRTSQLLSTQRSLAARKNMASRLTTRSSSLSQARTSSIPRASMRSGS